MNRYENSKDGRDHLLNLFPAENHKIHCDYYN
jgi:hypothetical protein